MGDLGWVLGIGYIGVWGSVHRAEEALLLTAPGEVVVAEALADELRLQGSTIENRDALLDRLRTAASVIARVGGFQLPGAPPPVPPRRAAARSGACTQSALSHHLLY